MLGGSGARCRGVKMPTSVAVFSAEVRAKSFNT